MDLNYSHLPVMSVFPLLILFQMPYTMFLPCSWKYLYLPCWPSPLPLASMICVSLKHSLSFYSHHMLSFIMFCAVNETVFAIQHPLLNVRLPITLIHSHYYDYMVPEVLSFISDALPTLLNWQCSTLHIFGTQTTHSFIQLASRHFSSISYWCWNAALGTSRPYRGDWDIETVHGAQGHSR